VWSDDCAVLCSRPPQTGRRTSRAEVEPPCRPGRTPRLVVIAQSCRLQGRFSPVVFLAQLAELIV